MKILSILPYYISWHYTHGISGFLQLWKNFLWFNYNFFSIPLLLRTLFAPFQRLKEQYQGGLHVEDFMSVVITNILMRCIGFIIRFSMILMGGVSYLVLLIGGVLCFLLWIILPFVLLFLLIASFIAIIAGGPGDLRSF